MQKSLFVVFNEVAQTLSAILLQQQAQTKLLTELLALEQYRHEYETRR